MTKQLKLKFDEYEIDDIQEHGLDALVEILFWQDMYFIDEVYLPYMYRFYKTSDNLIYRISLDDLSREMTVYGSPPSELATELLISLGWIDDIY